MQDGGSDDHGRCEFDHATEEVEASITFTGTCRIGIAPVISLREDLIERFVWVGHPIKTHPPAFEQEMDFVFAVLRTLD